MPGDWPDTVTHIAVDGNLRVAAAAQVDAVLPCIVRNTNTKDSAGTMAVDTIAVSTDSMHPAG